MLDLLLSPQWAAASLQAASCFRGHLQVQIEAEEQIRHNGLTELKQGRLGEDEFQGRLDLTETAIQVLLEDAQAMGEEEAGETQEWLDSLPSLPDLPVSLAKEHLGLNQKVNSVLENVRSRQ